MNRLKKLADSVDRLAGEDELAIERARAIEALRTVGAVELHGICESFTRNLNELLRRTELRLDPGTFSPEKFLDAAPNLFQMNVRGRILQIAFSASEPLISTENFREPYILEGTLRCFNQDLIERHAIEERLLFYCSGRSGAAWRCFDPRTYQTAALDQDYLIQVMERIV